MPEKRLLIPLDDAVTELMARCDFADVGREAVEAAVKNFVEAVVDAVVRDPVWYTDSPNSPFTGMWDECLRRAAP